MEPIQNPNPATLAITKRKIFPKEQYIVWWVVTICIGLFPVVLRYSVASDALINKSGIKIQDMFSIAEILAAALILMFTTCYEFAINRVHTESKNSEVTMAIAIILGVYLFAALILQFSHNCCREIQIHHGEIIITNLGMEWKDTFAKVTTFWIGTSLASFYYFVKRTKS